MPKYDLTQEMTNLDGTPIRRGEQEKAPKLTLKDVLCEAAVYVEPGCQACRRSAKELSGKHLEEMMDLYMLAKEMQDKDSIDLKIAQVKSLQEQVLSRYQLVPVIAMQVHKILEADKSVDEEVIEE